MSALTPSVAAKFAEDAYQIQEGLIGERTFKSLHKNKLSFEPMSFQPNTTGGIFYRRKFGFAVLAMGKKGSDYEGEAFLIFKGTKGLADILTDLNTGFRSTPKGNRVHAGFAKAMEELKTAIDTFVANAGAVTHFNCIGHSLGGAVATLAADQIAAASAGKGRSVRLFTFGSPRVGDLDFARQLETRVGTDNIFRVNHTSDPVPAIPTFPFHHTAASNEGYRIYTSACLYSYHLMGTYRKSCKNKTWKSLTSYNRARYSEAFIKAQLNSNVPMMLTYGSIELLSKMLNFVIHGIVKAGAIVIGGAYASFSSLFDKLTYIMSENINIEGESSLYIASRNTALSGARN